MSNCITIEASNVPLPLDAGLPTDQGKRCVVRALAKALGVKPAAIVDARLLKRSVDARKRQNVHFVSTLAVDLDVNALELPDTCVQVDSANVSAGMIDAVMSVLRVAKGVNVKLHEPWPQLDIPDCSHVAAASDFVRPVVIGAGPAGLFAALFLAEAGLRPLLLERGECAQDRQATVDAFAQGAPLNPNSNIQFGEGGAGTFSDGKLTTGTKSPHIRHVLQAFVDAGAPGEILWQAKPHIGTDLLPGVVTNLRKRIIEAGGEVRFGALATYVHVEPCRTGEPAEVAAIDVRDLETGEVQRIPASVVVLACGHSARDTFAMLQNIGMAMERKPFAMGVRIEHPQKWLDDTQYARAASHPALGAADYKLAVHLRKDHKGDRQVLDGRGVYTFCMCPGGEVVAAASEEGGVCVNGMSRFARDGENCNSALLVEVRPDDLPGSDPLEGVRLQRDVERAAYEAGLKASGVSYAAPAQTVGEFLRGAASESSEGAGGKYPSVVASKKAGAHTKPADSSDSANVSCTLQTSEVVPTYPRGVAACDLRDVLPAFMCDAMQEALSLLDRKLRGFANPAAVMTAVEARSSSPVRIVRDAETLECVTAAGFYPCGEGAGYAGGIMSAACDGLRVAECVCQRLMGE